MDVSYRDYLLEQNRMDNLYSAFQKRSGLSDAEFWCLYSIHRGDCAYQHEMRALLFLSKQTVNSALKQLVKKGLVEVRIPPENQRLRAVVPTPEGRAFCRRHFDMLDDLERLAWDGLSEAEQTAMVEGLRKINRVLEEGLQKE